MLLLLLLLLLPLLLLLLPLLLMLHQPKPNRDMDAHVLFSACLAPPSPPPAPRSFAPCSQEQHPWRDGWTTTRASAGCLTRADLIRWSRPG